MTTQPIRVTVWGENIHEKKHKAVSDIYPKGMHAAIAEGLEKQLGQAVRVRTATLDQPEHGLTAEVLEQTVRDGITAAMNAFNGQDEPC